MKTIEEKAKAYDKAIKIAMNNPNCFVKDVIEDIFPELKESEDEKIRKALMQNLKERFGTKGNMGEGLDMPDVLAWLKKQCEHNSFSWTEDDEAKVKAMCEEGNLKPSEREWLNNLRYRVTEQKPTDKIEPKFKVGDTVTVKPMSCHGKVFKGEPFKIVDIIEDNYVSDDGKAYSISLQDGWELVEQKPANKVEPKFHEGEWINGYYTNYKVLSVNNDGYVVEDVDGNKINILFENEKFHHLFTIADAKDGDLIYVSTEEKGVQAIFHEYKNGIIFFHCYLCRDFAQGGYMPIGSVELACPLQKTHYNRFFEKMHEAGYEWDAEKKELKKIEQNLDWSEEDEKKLNYLIAFLQNSTMTNNALSATNEGIEEWLKSLKERYTWKPSEEQIKGIKCAIKTLQHQLNVGDKRLNSLYDDLKKLRQE